MDCHNTDASFHCLGVLGGKHTQMVRDMHVGGNSKYL